MYFHRPHFHLRSFKNIILFILKNQDILLHFRVPLSVPRSCLQSLGLAAPKTLTGIHGLDSDRRVAADGEAKAVLPPRDGDLGHSPARLLPEAVRLLPLLQGQSRPHPRATFLSKVAGAKEEAGQPLAVPISAQAS